MLDRFARANHGIVTHETLLAADVAPRTITRWVATGRLVRVHERVYRVVGAPVTWEGRVAAAVLAGGPRCLASHRSAARLWGFYDGDEVDITVPRGATPRLRDVRVHRPMDAAVPSLRRGIRVTNPLRTLVDLGAVLPEPEVADAFTDARARKLVTYDGVERACLDLARPGRRGTGVLKRVLDAHALAMEQPDSRLEIRMFALMRSRGLPLARFQHWVTCFGRDYRIDFAYPEILLAIEVDGFASRVSPQAMQADLERQNDLIECGWLVIRFTWRDVVRRPAKVAGRLSRVLGARSATCGGSGATN